MNPVSVSPARWRFVYLLNVAQRRVQSAVQDSDPSGTMARAGLLMAIPKEGAPMARLGRQLDLGPPALSGLIDRAVRAGLIRRHPDPADGRAWILTLTPEGARARNEAITTAAALNARLSEGFTGEELAIVARWLVTIAEKFPREKK